jgi:fatty acid-binding protein DegV
MFTSASLMKVTQRLHNMARFTSITLQVTQSEKELTMAKGFNKLMANGKQLSIVDGDVKVDGLRVGRLEQALKHGYHPVVSLTLNSGYSTTYELDVVDGVVAAAVRAIELQYGK